MTTWREYPLGELLSYEQPTPYIVESVDYNDTYETPVLTAGKSFIIGYTDEKHGVYDKLPVIIFDDFTTSTQFVNFPFKVKSSAMKILTANTDLVLPKFIFYRMQLVECDHSTHKRYWIQHYSKIQVAIPPLLEQKRIVAKIEELFSTLDNGIETLEKTKLQLAAYRQAVLRAAFEGRLTQVWRKMHPGNSIAGYLTEIRRRKLAAGNLRDYRDCELIPLAVLPANWKWIHIGDITSGPEYGTSQKSLKEGRVPVLRMGNLKNGEIDWSDLVFSNNPVDNEKYRLSPFSVLFNRTNSPEHVGKTAIFRGEREAIFAGYLIRINQFDCINPEYLNYYMNSFTARIYANKVKTDGVNQSNINGKKLCSCPFPVCTEEEQSQVVFELQSRLSLCENIEKTVDAALQQAESLRQGILKKAFEGRL